MQKKSFKKETDALHQIAKASEAIRRKHQLIKLGKESVDKAMSEALKPVVMPLEKLVTHSVTEKKQMKKQRGRRVKKEWSPPLALEDTYRTAFEVDNEEEDGADDEYMGLPGQADSSLPVFSPKPNSSSTIDPLITPTKMMMMSPMEKSTPHAAAHVESLYDDEDIPERLLNQYLKQLTTNPSNLDLKYGVRKLKSGMHLGNTPVTFNNNIMKLGNQQYALTSGLIELIFKKSPKMSLVTQTDMQNYSTILRTTNAARKNYNGDNSIRSDPKLLKYVNIIKKLVGGSGEEEEVEEETEDENEIKTGSALPQYLIASRKRPPADYIYWDDPNELVDRLRLLIASRSAGNPSHSNEIVSIIEELREAQIIY